MRRIEIKANQTYYLGIKEACIYDCFKLKTMKQYSYFFGVDISKKTVDITLAHNETFTHRQFTNDEKGMKLLQLWLKELQPPSENTLFVWKLRGYIVFL